MSMVPGEILECTNCLFVWPQQLWSWLWIRRTCFHCLQDVSCWQGGKQLNDLLLNMSPASMKSQIFHLVCYVLQLQPDKVRREMTVSGGKLLVWVNPYHLFEGSPFRHCVKRNGLIRNICEFQALWSSRGSISASIIQCICRSYGAYHEACWRIRRKQGWAFLISDMI